MHQASSFATHQNHKHSSADPTTTTKSQAQIAWPYYNHPTRLQETTNNNNNHKENVMINNLNNNNNGFIPPPPSNKLKKIWNRHIHLISYSM